MSLDQRKSFRIQIPEGRERASLLVGKQQVDVHILDESAGGFAVALLSKVEVFPNQVHLLKSATGLYETRIARVEQFEDGKLIGLIRLKDLSDTGEDGVKSSWRDYLLTSQQSTGLRGGISLGIGTTAVVGVLVYILAVNYIKSSPTRRSSAGASPIVREYSEALTSEIEKSRAAAKASQAVAKETERAAGPGRRSAEYLRQQARLSAEVLYRLRLDADQSRRIRDILHRTAGNPSAAEAEIQSVLTEEQASQWQSLAP